MILTSLASGNNYIICNQAIARKLGLECAILIGQFCEEYEFCRTNGTLVDDSFCLTQENIEKRTSLTRHKQMVSLKKLISVGVISVKKMGLPAKNYYRINEEALKEIICNTNEE